MKKKKFIIVITILIIIGIVGYFIYDYYKRLDGRECLTCPYVYDLTPNDVTILSKNLTSNGNGKGYTATVTIGTVHEDLIVDGTVELIYKCSINYCFVSSYIYQCQWNFEANGYKEFEFDNKSTSTKSFTINTATNHSDLYMHQNSITCDFSIGDTRGDFEIYGEKIR